MSIIMPHAKGVACVSDRTWGLERDEGRAEEGGLPVDGGIDLYTEEVAQQAPRNHALGHARVVAMGVPQHRNLGTYSARV